MACRDSCRVVWSEVWTNLSVNELCEKPHSAECPSDELKMKFYIGTDIRVTSTSSITEVTYSKGKWLTLRRHMAFEALSLSLSLSHYNFINFLQTIHLYLTNEMRRRREGN